MTADPRGLRGPAGERAILAAVLVIAAAILLFGARSHSLWTPDEPTGAAVGRAMFERGDYLVPQLNGRPFLEKPPLYWWTQAAAFRVFGVSDGAARVPSAAFSWLTLVLTYAIGRRLAGPIAGVIAVAVLATIAEFSEQMTRVVVDPALVFFVALCHLGFLVLASPRSRREVQWANALIAGALPLAFLSKGVVAIGLAVAAPLMAMALIGRADPAALWRRVRTLAAIGPAIFALVVGPWAFGVYHDAGWPALRECLIGNTLGRAFTTASSGAYGHRQPIWYYLTSGAVAMLPWIIVVPAVIRARPLDRDDLPRGLLLTTCAIGVALLSVAASKRTMYLLPLLPAFAACVGAWAQGIDDASEARTDRAWDRPTLAVLTGLACAVPIAVFVAALFVRNHQWSATAPWAMARVAATLPTSQLWMMAAIASVSAIWGIVRITGRHSSRSSLAGVLVAYLTIGVAYQTAAKAFIDPEKNLHDLTAAIARQDPGTRPVYAYRPSESLQAIVNFDLDREVESLQTADDILVFFAGHSHASLVLPLDVAAALPPAVRVHLQYVYDETGLKASPYAIAIWM